MKSFVSVLALVLIAGLAGCSDSPTPTGPSSTTGQVMMIGTLTDGYGAPDATFRMMIEYDRFALVGKTTSGDRTAYLITTDPVRVSIETDSPILEVAMSALESSTMTMNLRTNSDGTRSITGSLFLPGSDVQYSVVWGLRVPGRYDGLTNNDLADVFATTGSASIRSLEGTELHIYAGNNLTMSVRGTQKLARSEF